MRAGRHRRRRPGRRHRLRPYAFGDGDVAAQRLRVLAETFAASTRAFLAEAVTSAPRVGVDLGCGLGYTTHLLGDVLGCESAIGIDSSERFIRLASRTSTVRVVFRCHDVTVAPLPADPADFVFCRFLLTHLTAPRDAFATWAAALLPKGRLLVEETEWIRTGNETYRRYVDVVEAMLAAQSNTLYAGRLLAGMENSTPMRLRGSQVARVPVANRDAARMFALNLRVWRDQPFIRATHRPAVIDALAAELTGLTEDRPDDVTIEWGLPQAVFERI